MWVTLKGLPLFDRLYQIDRKGESFVNTEWPRFTYLISEINKILINNRAWSRPDGTRVSNQPDAIEERNREDIFKNWKLGSTNEIKERKKTEKKRRKELAKKGLKQAKKTKIEE